MNPTASHRGTSRYRKLASVYDAWLLLELFLLKVLCHVAPEGHWPQICRNLSRFIDSPERTANAMRRYFVGEANPHGDIDTLARQAQAARREHWMQILHAWGMTQGTQNVARTRLSGQEVIEAALAKNRGIVLWLAHFAFAPLASKMALAGVGYRVWQMSRPEHGFSKTRLGIRALNPLRSKVEERFLAGRLLIDRHNPAAATLRAARLLARNAIISITAGDWEGVCVLRVPFGPGTVGISNGAPGLAHLTGATLIPLITVRRHVGGPIDVVAETPIDPGRGLSQEIWVEAALTEFAQRVTPYILSCPEQWRDWNRWEPDSRPCNRPAKVRLG